MIDFIKFKSELPRPYRYRLAYNNFWKFICKYFEYIDISNKYIVNVSNVDLHIYGTGNKDYQGDGFGIFYKSCFILLFDYSNFKIYKVGKRESIKFFTKPELLAGFCDGAIVVRFVGSFKLKLTPMGKLEIFAAPIDKV